MTNGEKLISDFPYIEIKGQDEVFTAIQIDTTGTGTPIIVYTEWWNTEYKEPTTKNDLGVDAVNREAVLDLIADYDLSMGQVVKGIHALPSVTPQEPKTGKWIYLKHNKAKCSECDDVVLIAQTYGNANYCPNCGARMTERESEK